MGNWPGPPDDARPLPEVTISKKKDGRPALQPTRRRRLKKKDAVDATIP